MSLRRKYIDGEKAFKYYFEELGAARNTRLLTTTVVKKNPLTDRKFTKDAFYKAMWRWACRPENENKSYSIFRKSDIGKEPEWTPEKWHAELMEKARWALTPRQYSDWYGDATREKAVAA